MKRTLTAILISFLMMNLCVPAFSFAKDEVPSADSYADPEQTASIDISSDVLWQRLAGNDRCLTMKEIVDEAFVSAETVIIATAFDYPDALAASGLAGIKKAPVLLTDGSYLSDQTEDEITRLGAKQAIIVGGEGAISSDVEKQIVDALGEGNIVERVSGDNRVATALGLYTEGIGSWSGTAIIATGYGFADALSISPFAYATKSPIFLTGSDSGDTELDSAVKDIITTSNFDSVIIVGGDGVVSASTESELVTRFGKEHVTRLCGNDRYETSAEIAEYALSRNVLGYNDSALATGANFPDALAGSTLCGSKASVLLLVDDTVSGFHCIETSICDNRAEITRGYILGGEGALSKGLLAKIDIVCAGGEVVMGNPIVDAAFSRIGCPYEYSAEGPDSFDCSGLVWWCYEQAGYDLIRYSSRGFYENAPLRLGVADAIPGDILWMDGHVGIYIGDGRYIHAVDEGIPVSVGSWMSMWTTALRY